METIYDFIGNEKDLKRTKQNKSAEKKPKKKKERVTISKERYEELCHGYSPGTWDGYLMGG